MVAARLHDDGRSGPFSLVVSGEAGDYVGALEQIVGRRWLQTFPAGSDGEMLELVRSGVPGAVVLDEEATQIEPLRLLRMIRQVNQSLLVVLLTCRTDRRWLEEALRLAAFSVVSKPLRLEELIAQIHRMMIRLDEVIRRRPF